MKKKVLSAILAASMVMGLAACGNNEPVPTATDDTQTATEAPATEAPAAEATEAAADVVPGVTETDALT